ncbi:uncharacterized protein LOC134816860 [Bolinopsis microptera]|uniref:uncharacterized protein LOC134816860 n=1 Tax=Bolinopsis microptera TaxID=2820187 RepID=UPI0030790492
MGILADKMLDYMVSNKYIDKSVHKGFLKKTPGCLEHTQVLMEELKDAKSTRRQIFVVWVDLMNAYGRVPHNLILYALRHYKFPEWLIDYILEKVNKQIKLMEQFLDWSRKMKAEPSKCVSLGMKVIDGTYQAYDPEILIDGQIISYVGNNPIKFLGHWIYVDLGLNDTKQQIEDKLKTLFQTVDECGLNGVMKCSIYNNMLTSKMSWDLMIYNLPVSKGHALKNSDDTKVVEAYNNKKEKQENSPRWSYTTELTARERDLYFQELFGVVTKDRVGLGCKPKLTERQKLRQLVKSVSENDMLVTLVNKGVQGKFLTWENTMQLDLGWNCLIYNYKMSPALLKFRLNSTHDVANTPANMILWNYSSTGNCTLCGWKTCNIKHILAVCSVARNSKRYNWRHDNVVRVIAGALLDQLKMYNSSRSTTSDKEWIRFKSKDGKYDHPKPKLRKERPFERAKDWKLIWDEDTLPAQFPQHIYNTAERPDIVVWSDSLREVVLIELTCGDESNFSDQEAL